jgi:hypothetical protein
MCTQRIGGSGLETILFPFLLSLRGLSRHLRFCLFLGKQAKKRLPFGFVRFPLKQMAKALDVEVRHRPERGRQREIGRPECGRGGGRAVRITRLILLNFFPN